MRPASTPARQADTRFIYPGGMEDWIDTDVDIQTEVTYLFADSHPPK